jgi:hypothetical protein
VTTSVIVSDNLKSITFHVNDRRRYKDDVIKWYSSQTSKIVSKRLTQIRAMNLELPPYKKVTIKHQLSSNEGTPSIIGNGGQANGGTGGIGTNGGTGGNGGNDGVGGTITITNGGTINPAPGEVGIFATARPENGGPGSNANVPGQTGTAGTPGSH